jgi:hypothetical protein
MMKKFTLLFILLTVSFGFSQHILIEDFEGTPPTFAGFEGLASATIEAAPSGSNGNSLKLVSQAAGNPWQGAEVIMQTYAIKLKSDKTAKVDVYSSQAFTLLAKVENGGPVSAAAQSFTTPGSWQTLTFTFDQALDGTNVADGEYLKIVFFPNWKADNTGFNTPPADFTIYVDNITAEQAAFPETCNDGIMNQDETGVDCGGVCAPCVAPPVVAAPTPPARDPADVLSIYSDAYAPKSFDNFSAGWCGNPAVEEVQIAGNNTMHYLGLPCQGIDFSSSKVDLTDFTHLHFDFFTDETDLIGKVFKPKFVDFGGGVSEASNFEINFTDGSSPAVTNGTWVSVDIDLTSLDPIVLGSLTRSDIAQIGISSNLVNAWYDNLYFHKNTTLGIDDNQLVSFSAYPNPSKNSWTVKTNNINISSIIVFDVLGKNVLTMSPNVSEVNIDASKLSKGLYFATVNTEAGSESLKLIKN